METLGILKAAKLAILTCVEEAGVRRSLEVELRRATALERLDVVMPLRMEARSWELREPATRGDFMMGKLPYVCVGFDCVCVFEEEEAEGRGCGERKLRR